MENMSCLLNESIRSKVESSECESSSVIKKEEYFNVTPWNELKTSSKEVYQRHHHSSVFYENQLFIYGGFQAQKGILSDFKSFKFGKEGSSWKDLPTKNGPGYLHSHSSIIYQHRIYIFGGKSDIFHNTNKLHVFDIKLNEWASFVAKNIQDGPKPTDSHQAILLDEQMIIYGGFSKNEYQNDIYSLNIQTKIWKKIYSTGTSVKEPKARCDFSLIERNSKFYIYGGKCLNQIFNDFWQFDLQKKQFQQIFVGNILLDPRSGHTAVLYEEKMIVFGGLTGITHERNDLIFYDFVKKSWNVVWENCQDQGQLEDRNKKKEKSLKKSSLRQRQAAKLKNITFQFQTEKAKKYRRPLKQQIMERRKISKQKMKCSLTKQNSKNIKILKQFELKDENKEEQRTFSPLLESLTTSICYNTSMEGSTTGKMRESKKVLEKKAKKLKARDGHTANINYETKQMIIFGGDRHTIGYNDIVMIRLEEIL